MGQYLSKSLLLMIFSVLIACGIYPLALWAVAQTVFPDQANGSLIYGPDGKVVGSRMIAQPFTKDEYFWPRPSAASYDASASAPSNLAASSYLLRDRVARALGPIVKYEAGAKAGQLVAPDVEAWFQEDHYQGQPHIVAQWADAHNELATAWVSADPSHAAYVDDWSKKHAADVTQWVKDNPGTPEPKAADLAVLFFESFSKENPGKFPSAVSHQTVDGKTLASIEPVKDGSDIQSTFFDMWRQAHPDVALQNVPGDMVTASGSGLDPNITLANAEFQLDRIVAAWAKDTKRDPAQVRNEIEQIVQSDVTAPFYGLVGEKMVNVMEVNLALRNHFGAPPA